MNEELKPCPFCGSRPDWIAGLGWFAVECMGCHVETDAYTEAETAAKVWNRRAHLQHLPLTGREPAGWANQDGLERLARARGGYAESPLLVVNAERTELFSVPMFAPSTDKEGGGEGGADGVIASGGDHA